MESSRAKVWRSVPEDNWDRVTRDLTVALDNDAPEHFATSGSMPDAANPGLYVKDFGSIGLPLSDRDAKDLIKASHCALAKGTDKTIDINVNKTWELDSSQVSLRNPQWQETLSKIVATAAGELGLAAESKTHQVQLRKLLLYEKGAVVECCKEEKTGKLGILMIALPSPHSGGSVVTKFGGQTSILNTDKRSDHGYSYLSWYADVESSVERIASGYRLVLTYDWIVPDAIPLSVSVVQSEQKVARVSEILEEWQNLRGEFPSEFMSLAYILDHHYAEEELRAGLLEGKDIEKWDTLKEACNTQGCCLYLALLTCSVSGSGEDFRYGRYDHWNGYVSDDGSSGYDGDFHESTSEEEMSVHLGFVCDENGEEIATELYIPPFHVVQEEAFACDPDDEEYQGRTRYEGRRTTHLYYRTCLLVLPQCDFIDFVFESEQIKDPSLASWVARLIESNSADVEEVSSRVLQKAAANQERRSFHAAFPTNETLNTIAGASLKLGWPAVFSRIAPYVEDALSPSIYRELGGVVAKNGFSKWQRAIETSFSSIVPVRSYLDAADNMVKGYKACDAVEPSDLLYLEDIRDKVFTKLDKSELSLEDLILILPIQEEALNQKIVPYMKARISRSNLVMQFLNLLRSHPEVASEPKKQAYSEVLKEFAGHFRLDQLHKETPSWNRDQSAFDKNALVDLLRQSLAFGVKDPVKQILEEIEIGARSAKYNSFEDGILPFMKCIIPVALKDNGPFPKLVCNLVDACLHRFVGNEPHKPQNWTKQASTKNAPGCGCKHCKAMDDFLLDPCQKEMRLEKFNQQEKKHLIAHCHYECVAETIRTVSPHALVLTKDNRIWSSHYDSWRTRCNAVNSVLGEVDQATMKKLLGDQYDRLISKNEIRLPAGPDHCDPPSTSMIVRTKQQVQAKQYKKPQKPQPGPRNHIPQKRPLTEMQANSTVDAKKPRLKSKTSYIDLTYE